MKHCESCDECVYVGEHEYLCMTIQEIVISENVPTEHYNGCNNK
jgi:hypothetical protein